MTTRPRISEQKATLTVMTAKIIMLLSKYPDGVSRHDIAMFQPSKNHTHVFKQAIKDLADGAIITRTGDRIKLNSYAVNEIDKIVITDNADNIFDSNGGEL